LIDEQRTRSEVFGQAMPADGEDDIAGFDVEAGCRQRRVEVAVPRIAAQDRCDAVPAGRLVPRHLGTQKTDPVLRRQRQIAAGLVGMRRAELALHLPDQIRQLAARADLCEQRLVAFEHVVPVDARHARIPKPFALQPPRFAQHLPPLRDRFHQHADAAEVEPSAAPSRFGVRLLVVAVVGQLGAGVERAQFPARRVHEGPIIAADHEVFDLEASGALRCWSKS
jgi:hypothetical protein